MAQAPSIADIQRIFTPQGQVGQFESLINTLPPGDSQIGVISGLISDILQRIPIPRPRLPAPRVPGPAPGPGPRLPIPIPIPFPGDIFGPGETACGPGGAANPCCRGFHLDKQTKTKCVRNRRMNPLNPRALKRALRRVDKFEDFVNKTASLTGLRLAKKSTRRKR